MHDIEALQPPWFDLPEQAYQRIRQERLASGADEDALNLAEALRSEGLAVLDFNFAPELLDRVAALTKTLLGRWARVENLWQTDDDVRQLACHDRVISLLSDAYGCQAYAFQTLNFPVGTEQPAHSDALHFSSVPFGFMCGVWIALEDVGPDQGPLMYYPGSHLLPPMDAESLEAHGGVDQYSEVIRREMQAHGLEPKTLCLKSGQAVVWAANLVHGGSPVNNRNLTRLSQVTHYYFRDCVYTTPMISWPSIGKVFVRQPLDVATSRKVPNRYLGRPVRPTPGSWILTSIRQILPAPKRVRS